MGWTPAQVAVYVRHVADWVAQDRAKAREILQGMLEQRARLDTVRHEIATVRNEAPGEQHAALLKKKQSPVWLWNDRVHLHLAVPAAAAEERLRIQFYAYDGATNFTVEARYPDARALLNGAERDLGVVESTETLAGLAVSGRSLVLSGPPRRLRVANRAT